MPSFSWTSVFTNQTLTRDNFITNFRSRVDEDTEDVINDTQIVEFIRHGLFDISFRAKLLPEYATVTPDGSGSYTLPTDMVELHDLYYVTTDSPAQYTLVLPYNLSQIQDNGYDTGKINYFVRSGQNIDVFGSSVTTGTLRAYGTRIPTFPATGGAYIDIPDAYMELLFLWCEWKYWARKREIDEFTIKRQMYFDMCATVSDQVRDQLSMGAKAYG